MYERKNNWLTIYGIIMKIALIELLHHLNKICVFVWRAPNLALAYPSF